MKSRVWMRPVAKARALGGFLEAFRAVGRFGPLVAETPVQIILNPKASLLGAAEIALDLALERRAAHAAGSFGR